MIRVALTAAEHEDLRARSRTAAPRERDRLGVLRLADAGWRVPRIARHLGRHEQTVRRHLKAFLAHGFAALPDRPRPGRPPRATDADLAALEARVDAGDRTWTARQLAAWLERERGVTLHPDHLRRLLRRRRFGWKRTVTSVAHKRRDQEGYAAQVEELGGLKRRPSAARSTCGSSTRAASPQRCRPGTAGAASGAGWSCPTRRRRGGG